MLLQVHSWFSLKYGVLSVRAILEQAKQGGYDCLALTDINNTSAVLDFVRLAPIFGVRPVVGIDFRNGDTPMYVGIARNNAGYQELCDFLSEHLHHEKPFPRRAPVFQQAYVLYPLAAWDGHRLLSHERLGVSVRDLNLLRVHPERYPAAHLVMMQAFTFRGKQDWNVHRLLRAIDLPGQREAAARAALEAAATVAPSKTPSGECETVGQWTRRTLREATRAIDPAAFRGDDDASSN